MNQLIRACSSFAAFALLASFLHAEKVAPKPLEIPAPLYPEALTDTGLSGKAEVDFVVGPDGTVTSAELGMATHRAFGKAAIAAVKTWKFQPGTVDGSPAPTRVTIPFTFTAPFEQQVNAVSKRKVFLNLPQPALSQKEYGAKLKVKKAPNPIYPRNVQGERSDEKVEVKFVINPDGQTLNPTVVGKPREEFIAPAIRAIAAATYEPPTKNGQGVYVETTTMLRFTDERPERGFEGGMRGGGGGRRGGGMGGGGGFGGGMGGGGGDFGGGGPD